MIKDFGIALAKVMLAGAWVDGHLHRDELGELEKFIDTIPGLSEEDLHRIYIYTEYPMTMEESRLAAELFVNMIQSEEEKQIALLHLRNIVGADKIMTPEEKYFIEELDGYIQAAATGTFKHFSNLLAGKNKWTKSRLPTDQDREKLLLDDYMNNPVYFRVLVAYSGHHLPDDLTPHQISVACLQASLLTLVNYDGTKVDEVAKEHIVDSLHRVLDHSEALSGYLADLAAMEASKNLSIRRQTHKYMDITTFSMIDELYYGIVGTLEKIKPLKPYKLERLADIARIFKIEDDVQREVTKRLT